MKKWILTTAVGLIYVMVSYAQTPDTKPDTTKVQLGKYELIVVEDGEGNTTVTMNTDDKKGVQKEKTYKITKDDNGSTVIIKKDEDGEHVIRIEEEVEAAAEALSDKLEDTEDKLEDKMEALDDKLEEMQDKIEERQEEVEDENYNIESNGRKLVIKRKKKKYKLYSNWGGLSVGYETFFKDKDNLSDAGIFNTDRSYSIRWEFYRLSMHLGTPYLALTSGMAWGGAFIPLKDNAQLETDENNTWITTDDTREYSTNKLTYTFLEVPVFLELFTGTHRSNNVKLSAGIINKLRLNAKTKYAYTKGGKDYTTTVKDDFNLFKYTPELSARLGYRGIGVFANIGVNPFFKKDKGPEVRTFTAGINVSFPVIKTGRAYRG